MTNAPGPPAQQKNTPKDSWRLPIGATPDAEGTHFRVWAANCTHVDVVVWKDERDHSPQFHPMVREDGREKGYLSCYVKGVHPGARYKYRLDGGDSFPDPASRYQPDGVHGPSQVVDPTTFDWTDADWQGIKLEDLVIYQLHVGTYTSEGTFDALITRLGHIRALGVTAILLMPVADFPGRRNWGYDGVDLFAPARAYGGPEALRRLVDAAHARGIAVLLDVVFNHLGPDGNYLSQFSRSYFRREEEYRTPWGPALNFDARDSQPVRDFFTANACYWAMEYHLDGLRLDAIQAIKDTQRPHIVADIASAVRKTVLPTGRSCLVLAEDEFNDPDLVKPTEERGFGLDAVYADDFHHQLHVALTGEKTGYYIDYSGTIKDLAKTMEQGWWFTGQWAEWRERNVGSPADDIPPQRFIYSIQNHDQVGNRPFGERLHHLIEPAVYRAASALLLLSPYTPLLFMGQEWAASTPFVFFTDHHRELGQLVTTGRLDGLNSLFPGYDRDQAPKPQAESTFQASKLRWEELSQPAHQRALLLYRDLLALRQKLPVLSRITREALTVTALSQDTLALCLEGSSIEETWLVVVNLRNRLTLNLHGRKETRPVIGYTWQKRLDTEDAKYGGRGDTHLTEDAVLMMSGAGAILMALKPVESTAPSSSATSASPVNLDRLRDNLEAYFSVDELRDLCSDMKIEYANLPGDRLADKARELVDYCRRRGRIEDLRRRCREARPHVEW